MKVRLQMRAAIEYLTVIFMLLDFYTPYSCALNIYYPLTRIASILVCVLLLINVYLYGIKNHVLNRWLLYFLPYYILVIIYFSFSVDLEHVYTFVSKFMIILPMLVFLFMLYIERGEMYRLLEKYVNVVTIIAGISLFFWLFGTQMKIIQPTNHIYASWGGNYNYPMWFGVYTQRQQESFFGATVFRNQGIFCEAPMYSFNLVVAIAFELFLKNHAKGGFSVTSNSSTIIDRQMQHNRFITFRLVLLVVTIFSTVSTTGIILLIMAFVLHYMLTRPRDFFLVKIKPLLVGIIGIAGLYLAIRIFLQKSSSYSWMIRFDDLRAGFLAFLSSPLTGTGFESYANIDMFRSFWRTAGGKVAGFSNSIMRILGQGGVLLGLVYFVPIIGAMWRSGKNKQYNILAFTAIITIAFSLTIVCYSLIMLTLIAFLNAYSIGSITRKQSVLSR